MITRPMLLDETGQKIKLALQRVKNKFLGTTTDPVTPGQAGSSGVSPVIQDDTGREIISALNDLADAVKPASTTEQGLVDTGTQKFGGQKIFDKVLSINYSSGTGYPILYFRDEVHHPVDELGGYPSAAMFNAMMDITRNRLGFALWSPKSDGTGYTTKSESFTFPVVDVGRTTNGSYRIITTKNIEDIPDADATTRGLVNTDAQTFAGDKTFNGDIVVTDTLSTGQNIYTLGLRITNTTGNGSSLLYRFSDAPSANAEYARIYMGAANYGGQLHFRQYSGTSSARTSYYEQYDLPKPDEGRTSTRIYYILTTKSPVTIEQGGTGDTGVVAYTPTRTENAYCNATSINRLIIYRWGKFGVLNLNLAISSSFPSSSTEIEICRFSGLPSMPRTAMQIVQDQGSGGHALVQLKSGGILTIYNGSGAAITQWLRAQIPVMFA